jgi:hypothetical protein
VRWRKRDTEINRKGPQGYSMILYSLQNFSNALLGLLYPEDVGNMMLRN